MKKALGITWGKHFEGATQPSSLSPHPSLPYPPDFHPSAPHLTAPRTHHTLTPRKILTQSSKILDSSKIFRRVQMNGTLWRMTEFAGPLKNMVVPFAESSHI